MSTSSVKLTMQSDGFSITSNGRFVDFNVPASDLVSVLTKHGFIVSQKEIERALKILETGVPFVSLSLRMRRKPK